MLVTFRVKDIETRLHSKPAQIRPPELAALMRRLHTANSTIDADPGEFLAAPLNFEINANALAIAAFASCFDHRAEMIAIVEEAQFLGRMLRIEHLCVPILSMPTTRGRPPIKKYSPICNSVSAITFRCSTAVPAGRRSIPIR